ASSPPSVLRTSSPACGGSTRAAGDGGNHAGNPSEPASRASHVETRLLALAGIQHSPAVLDAAPAAHAALEEQAVGHPQHAAARLAGVVDFLQGGVDQVDVGDPAAESGLVAA